MNCTVRVAKRKALISCAVTAQTFCVDWPSKFFKNVKRFLIGR